MIEYMYSRMIAAMASAALVVIVVAAAFGASEQASRDCAVDIAESIFALVAEASATDADYFEHRLLIASEGFAADLCINISSSCVEVEKGQHSVKCIFERPVTLLDCGSCAASLQALPGSTIVIKSSKEFLQKENNVTIEILADHLADGGDEPLRVLAVIVDVEGGAGGSVRHPPVLEHGVRAVHA